MLTVVKRVARGVAVAAVSPMLASYAVRRRLLGADRALMGSTQALSVVPGLIGQYLRGAFLRCVLARCSPHVTVEFGTIFSRAGAEIDENVYIGPMCHIGLVHLERDVLVGAGVHIPSGPHTHGLASVETAIRDQPGRAQQVRIGAGSWLGSACVVMADVGPHSVVAAGAVVTRPVPPLVIAAGVPATVMRQRDAAVTGVECESSS
jgi:virginiamycin A acetyltransferase